MKVGVTGGAGFIGSHITDRLIDDGHEVMVLDHSAPGFLRNLGGDAAIEFFHGDVRDATTVTEFAGHVDAMIHLAAVLGTQETISNPRPSAETNILGSLNVFEAAAQYDLPVVYAGVGNHWMRDQGAGAYTITKTAVEDFTRMYKKFRGTNISVVRPVNAYGPRQSVAAPFGPSKVRKIIPSFACRALTGYPVEVYGDGTQVSDCVFVTDVARAFAETLYRTESVGALSDVIEVGPAESYEVNDVAALVISAAQSGGWVDGIASEIVHLPMRPGEVPNATVTADQHAIAAHLGIVPATDFTPLTEGIHETVRWYAQSWLPEWKAMHP